MEEDCPRSMIQAIADSKYRVQDMTDRFAEIAQTYDWTDQPGDDIPFFTGLAPQKRGWVLEIGAGTGRITVRVAAQGNPVAALDVSESMLSRARAKATAGTVSFVLGDFRALSLNQTFTLILASARVFEHALSDSERHAAFVRCAAHLQRSGIFALHIWGPPADNDLAPPEKCTQIDPTDEHGRLSFYWREERDFVKELRRHYYRIREIDRRKRVWEHGPIELRWYTREALDELGRAAGLTVKQRFRDFHQNPWETGSLNMIWVYRKE